MLNKPCAPFLSSKSFYQTTLRPQLEILEAERLQTVKEIYKVCTPVGIIGAVIAGFILFQGEIQGAFVVAFLTFAVCGILFSSKSRGYVSDFKQKVISELVSFFDPNLKYYAPLCSEVGKFIQCQIFQTRPDRYSGDDLVKGVLGVTPVEFSEIHAQYVTHDSKGRTTYHTIFKGLFFIADFNKNFNGQTFVLTDSTEGLGMIGNWLQGMGSFRGELVKLEDPEFEKMFVVYSSDQIEARYILSTSLMARIVEFAKKSGRRIQMSFVGSKIYIAVPYDRNLFEPRVFETILDFAPVQQYFEDLQLVIGIVEDLNLN